MRTAIVLMFSFVLTVLTCMPVFAAEQQDMKAEDQTATPSGTSDALVADEGVSSMRTCSNCGKRFTVGRHGQEGQIMKCPYCGKECEKEEEKGFCIGADMAFMSKYVSRGMTTNDDPVFEPNLWASYKGFTFSAWGNLDLTNYGGMSGNFNEADYTLDYSNSLDKLGYSVGVIYYTFPHSEAKDTSEVYAGVSYDVLLQPKIVVYYDFWQADGFYGNFSVSHGFELPEIKGIKSSLDLSAQVGLGSKNFNEFNFGDSHTAFTDMVFTASLPVAISDHFSVKPTVSYSTALDRTIRTKNFKNDNVIWGAVISASL